MLSAVRQQAEHKRVLAAVAYVGDGADHLLPLKAGDTVVVNGSRNALASGATSARILREWYEQGVEVYSHPTLHAKVFVIGRTAIVGSANLSQRASFDNTAEAAIQTTDRAIVGQARDFVKRMEDDATNVDETWLKMAEKVPVERSPAVPWDPASPFAPDGPYDIWVVPWEDTDFTEDEMKLAEHARHLRGGDGRYGVHEISEDPEEVVRLGSSDMVVLIKPRSTQLLRFIERKATATAAMGFYRTDRYAASVSLGDLADALGTTIPELKSGWFRASKKERATLIKLFDLPDLPARRH